MRFKPFLALSLLLMTIPSFVHAEYGIYYGTNASYAKRTAQTFDMMIVQPYNFNLYSGYTGKKICYLTVGEFDGTASELTNLGLSGAQVGFNSTWNSYIMNMSNSLWQDYLVKEEGKLKTMGCNGLFLDTIWQDGQESGGIDIVKKLRENWQDAYIIPNNAHNIKKEIVNYVDGYMFENFWDKTIKDGSGDANWLLSQMQEYANIKNTYGKRLVAINYWNPFVSQAWGQKTKNLAIKYGFDIIYANINLTTINGYLNLKTGALTKLPALAR